MSSRSSSPRVSSPPQSSASLPVCDHWHSSQSCDLGNTPSHLVVTATDTVPIENTRIKDGGTAGSGTTSSSIGAFTTLLLQSQGTVPLVGGSVARTKGENDARGKSLRCTGSSRDDTELSGREEVEGDDGSSSGSSAGFHRRTDTASAHTIVGRTQDEGVKEETKDDLRGLDHARGRALPAGPSAIPSSSSPSPSTAAAESEAGAVAVSPARPSAVTSTSTPSSTRPTSSTARRARSASLSTTASNHTGTGQRQRQPEQRKPLDVLPVLGADSKSIAVDTHTLTSITPSSTRPRTNTTSTIATTRQDKVSLKASSSGGPIAPAASTGIWNKLYTGLFSSKSKRGAETYITTTTVARESENPLSQAVEVVKDRLRSTIPAPAPRTPGSGGLSDGVSPHTSTFSVNSGPSTSAQSTSQNAQEPESPATDLDWSRTASVGSIHGLLSSAYDYISSVSRSVSLAPSPLSQTNDAPTTTAPAISDSQTTSTLSSPSRPRQRRNSSQGTHPPPVSTVASVARSFSLSTRLHAAYQAILSPTTTSLPASDITSQTRQHLIQSEIHPIRHTTTTVTLSTSPPSSRASSVRQQRKQQELEAVLNGQQRSGATMHRRNTTNASPAKGGGGGSGSNGTGGGSRREQKYATDYFRPDRENATSPPPLPIPNSSMTRNGGDGYYRQQTHPSPNSRSTTPATQSVTTTTSGPASRRNTIDSLSASFSSFYTSATSVAPSSNRDREREQHRQMKERPSSRNDQFNRAVSPDIYSQGNTQINMFSVSPPTGNDPHATARLEDRCRHLEKNLKELQARLRSKDQEIKMRDSELRSREMELKAKDTELRQKDDEYKEKEGEVRKREGDLRDREEELREVEAILRDMEVQVRRRDEELERYKVREQQWQRELQRQRQQTEKELSQRKSMKELVDQSKEHVEKLERALKRRATASPLNGDVQRNHSRHNSHDAANGTLAVSPEEEAKMSTSAPSASHLAKGYAESKRQQLEAASESSSSLSSSSVGTTRTAPSNQVSPGTSPSPSPAPSRQQRTAPSIRQLAIPKGKAPPAPPPESILPFTEEHAQQRSDDEFLTRTDGWSGAQVLQAVNDINSEVVQFAAVVTEMCRFAPREVPSPSPSPTPYATPRTKAKNLEPANANPLAGTKPYADTAARLGGALTHLLATYDHSNDPILVQLALQACITIASKRAWESFCLGLPAKSDGVLSVIYRSLKELEPQPTSSKWRSLTHGHIHAIYPTLAAYSANELAETMLRWTLDILTLAGCVRIESSASTPTAAPSPGQDSLANYGLSLNTNPIASLRTQHTVSLILPQLLHITTALTRLENVLRQDILSTSFDLVIPECGMMFGKEWMVDFFGLNGNGPDGASTTSGSGEPTKVLGSVEVGLMCRTRVGMRGGGTTPITPSAGSILGGQGTNMSQQQQGGGSSGALYEERLLLMPKVILESVVDLL